MAKLLASSLDNFVLLNNSYAVDAPYVTFTVGSPSNVTITIKDANNDDGYNKVITGNSTSTITSDSFSTNGVVTLNLLECLKMNSIFFGISLQSANTIKAFIDTSIQYRITVSGSGISVGGTYSSFNPLMPNKMVMMLQGTIDENTNCITMEKYNNASTVSFNVTAPFNHASFSKPLNLSVTAYQLYDNTSSMVTVPDSSVIILPTTLSKFQSVDYGEFYGAEKVHFLTHSEERQYNYGEHFGLSILTDGVLTLKKNYYTNSGVFLESQTSVEYTEKNSIRQDFYDTFDLNTIEARYHTQVGYVMVYAVSGSTEKSYPVKYNVVPACSTNNEIFFINEIGGVDSFNFTGVKDIERKIGDVSTFFKNPIKPFTDTYEIESVKLKENEVKVVLRTKQISRSTAEWLNEMAKSKYCYRYLGVTNPKFMVVIIDEFRVDTNTSDDEFELEMEYHVSDNSLMY